MYAGSCTGPVEQHEDTPLPQAATRGLYPVIRKLLFTVTEGCQAELNWVAGYIPKWSIRPLMDTHPCTNWAQVIVSLLWDTRA